MIISSSSLIDTLFLQVMQKFIELDDICSKLDIKEAPIHLSYIAFFVSFKGCQNCFTANFYKSLRIFFLHYYLLILVFFSLSNETENF